MRALASFISGPHGIVYGRVCERWGRDPAAFLQDEDEVLAFDFRAALTLAMAAEEAEQPEEDEAAKHQRMIAQARRASEDLRRGLPDG